MERVMEKVGIKPLIYRDFGQRNLNESLGEYPLWFALYDVQ